jgi:hypothetical protein
VRGKRLAKYIKEESFRYNERKKHDRPRLVKAVKSAEGKRLT